MHEFEKDLIEHFVHDYLESDGLFILRVLSSNTSDFVCTELIQELWKYYRKQRKFNRSSEEEEDVNDDESINNDKHLEYSSQKKFTHDYPEESGNDEETYQDVTKTSVNNSNFIRSKRYTISGANYATRQNRLGPMSTYNNTNNNSRNAQIKKSKQLAKPLAAISEQIASIYNKSSKKQSTLGDISPIAENLNTTTTTQRPKLNRTVSHDSKSLINNVNNNNNNNSYLVVNNQQTTSTERKPKRPTNLATSKKLEQNSEPSPSQPGPPLNSSASSTSPDNQKQQAENSNEDETSKDLKSKYFETET